MIASYYRSLSIALAASVLLFVGTSLRANDIQVTNVSLADTDLDQGITHVAFDISWQNSWRGGGVSNWDAAWVFVKYRLANGVWHHAYVDNSGHTLPAGAQLELGLLMPGEAYDASTNPVIGVFLHRDADGNGTFNAPGARLRWDYGALGLAFNDLSAVQVFAIEMVYVNEGAFFLGTGGTEIGSFTDGAWTSGPPIPYHVTSEAAITIGQSPGNLWGTSNSGSSTIGPGGSLPAVFPKGFNAFYCMKYEITQQQYVDFLNTLTRTQQNTHTATDLAVGVTIVTNFYAMRESNSVGVRNSIRCDASIEASAPINFYCDLNSNGIGGESDDGQWIACNFLSWVDLTAYLDWSGLRPMSELEYEKACRGILPPVPDEFPWGIAEVMDSEYSFSDMGTASEGITINYSATAGNAIYSISNGTPFGPKRVGMAAANSANNGRVSAGASYYGIMELGGNLEERIVNIGTTQGRAYSGLHGNGDLATNGEPNVDNWPASDGQGIGFRGGSWSFNRFTMRVSQRSSAVNSVSTIRSGPAGGRGCRSVP